MKGSELFTYRTIESIFGSEINEGKGVPTFCPRSHGREISNYQGVVCFEQETVARQSKQHILLKCLLCLSYVTHLLIFTAACAWPRELLAHGFF